MSKIHSIIPKIMSEVGAITKNRTNSHQGYKFRGIDDAYAAFQPLFAKHGVFVVPQVTKMTREERPNKSGGVLIYTTLEVRHTFYAEDASSFDCITVGEAMDSGDKSCNKALSAAMKYALLEVFCVPTEADNDTENHSPEPLQKPKATAPPPAPEPPKKFTEKDRVRFIEKLLVAIRPISPVELQEFCEKSGIVIATESADTDWPLHKLPATKKDFDDLVTNIKNFVINGDNIP